MTGTWKKAAQALLYPPAILRWVLLPLAAAFLVYTMVFVGTETIPAYIAYALSAYTLTVWCMQIPGFVRAAGEIIRENRYAQKWMSDMHLRINATLLGGLVWNLLYAALQTGLGLRHGSFWYYSMAAYYACVGVMRLCLLGHIRQYAPGEQMRKELVRYRACGWVFLLMNMALALMVFFMVYWNRTFYHGEITTIALAAYTFASFAFAIVNIVKFRRYNSPVLSASKAISMACACVSMITLESTMLTTFGAEEMDMLTRKLFLAYSGGAVSAFVIGMAVFMIVRSTKALGRLERNIDNNSAI